MSLAPAAAPPGMFAQLLTPVAASLPLSFLVASLPVAVVLVTLGLLRRPAWQASLAGLIVALGLAILVWRLPPTLAFSSIAAGATFALWPVMWIVANALLLYNIAVRSGRFDAFRDWMVHHLPNDRRVALVVVGFCFGALLEGVSGFGTPVAITTALLIALGFQPLEALVYTLLFNTAPVAFGALGAPVTTLGAVTQLPAETLGAMIGRQLPFIAVLLPFYVIAAYAGWRSVRALWPVLTVAGGSFASAQFVASNLLNYELTDVLSSLVSLVATLGFLKLWRPGADPAFALTATRAAAPDAKPSAWRGWSPWLLVSGTVIIWSTLAINRIGEHAIEWPGLHREVFITLYGQPYAAVWTFQPLATGTAILLTALGVAAISRLGLRDLAACLGETWRQVRLAILTVVLIISLAYLMNYSGMTYTLGLGMASAGWLFPILSAFLGWLAVFLTGSDTAGNALFGNLQVVAARQLDLDPVLIAATNSSGGVMGKIISPQNIATGASVTNLKGQEGAVLARVFKHSLALTLLLGLLVMAQQYLVPWMIPR
jgi:lactate permease